MDTYNYSRYSDLPIYDDIPMYYEYMMEEEDVEEERRMNNERPIHYFKEMYKQIPIKKYKWQNNDTCSICLETFKRGCNVNIPKCSHVFHTKCLLSWVNCKRYKCPVCRQCLVDDNIVSPPPQLQHMPNNMTYNIQQSITTEEIVQPTRGGNNRRRRQRRRNTDAVETGSFNDTIRNGRVSINVNISRTNNVRNTFNNLLRRGGNNPSGGRMVVTITEDNDTYHLSYSIISSNQF